MSDSGRSSDTLRGDTGERQVVADARQTAALLTTGALQSAIFNSANFSSIATDAKGVIQIFNVGAERMLGYAAAEVMNKITPADISDPLEVIARAKALSVELSTPINPGFEALVFKASRGIEDIYELTYIRKNGSRFPAVVSVTALRDAQDAIIGYLLIGTDNTARKQAEEALLKAGALQRAIFNSANFSSIATDAKGVIQIFNVGAERMLGYAAAEVMNKITPADISDPRELVARARSLSAELGTTISPGFEALVFKASRGIEDIYELTYIRKDGSRFPAVVSVTALRDAQNAIIGYLLIGTDNTARKLVEEELPRLNRELRAISNINQLLMRAEDEQTLLNEVCRVICDEVGYRMAWVGYAENDEAKTIRPVGQAGVQNGFLEQTALTWADTPAGARPSGIAIRSGESASIQDLAVDPESSPWQSNTLQLGYRSTISLPLQDESEHTFGVLSIYSALPNAFTPGETRLMTELAGDLAFGIRVLRTGTERKQIEAEQLVLAQRLRDHQFYTRSLFESNTDALLTTDPSGIITDVNKETEALTGCTRDELIGAPFKGKFTDPERAGAGIRRVLGEKRVDNYELTVHGRDRKETGVSINAATFYDRDRKLQGVFVAARDVTERRRLDQELQKKNVELESARSVADKANLAKSEFLSSMSHELRSPLNAILGFAQLMDTDSTPVTTVQKDSIARILQSGWHLLKLIDEILDLAKVESSQVPMSREPVSLAETMLECRGMMEPLAQQRGIRLTFPAFSVPSFVMADRTRVKQVIINLLSNAIKYNRKQGTVTVELAASTPGRTRVNIRDSGAGLTAEQLAQLFQPFNRLGQANGGEEGTGIGLVVTKRLVELMGGTIGVASTVGVGSVFWFELAAVAGPRLSVEVPSADALAAQPLLSRDQGPMTLLYVEDNPANLELVERIIARYPHIRLLTAVDGTSGIEMAQASQPDVILMDINLPGINGFEALRLLRSAPATAHIPVIAISANAMQLDVAKGLDAGFFRYITKPINVTAFVEAMDVALQYAHAGVSPAA